MVTKAFSVYDAKGKFFGVPFFMLNEGLASRAFDDLVNDPHSFVNKHPEDYQLYEIGEFRDDEAVMVTLTPMKLVATGLQFKKSQPEILDNWRISPVNPVNSNHKEETEVKKDA